MSEIKIDKGVPVPPLTQGRRMKYPFRQMEVGDSFFVPGVKTSSGFSGCLHGVRKSTGWTFTCRSRVEDGVQGVRVWRIE
jgi:hypothetical protein